MAIGTNIAPVNKSSVHDDLWHTVESNFATAVDFKYVFDLFVDGKQLIRTKIYPNPSDYLGYFNASNIISNEMKFDWFDPNGNFIMKELNDSGEILMNYEYRVGEDVGGITTLNMASGIVQVANCVPNLFGRRISPTSVLNNTTVRFLTNREKVNKTSYGEDFYIGTVISRNENLDYIEVKQYNSSDQLLTSGTISIANGTKSNVFQLNISPDGLNQGFPASGNIFQPSCEYYVVNLRTWNGTTFSLVDSIKMYFDCNKKYEVINLHFMNNYGVFDTARFTCVSKLNMEAQRKTFEKPDYKLNNGVSFYQTFGNNREYYESKINYGSQYQWTYKLTMDFPSDQDYKWLAELIMSPQVWAEIRYDNDEKEYYPVSIKATNYEYSKHINNGLRAFEVEIDMNQKRNGFRR